MWLEMYVDVQDSVNPCEKNETRAPLRYDKPLKRLTGRYLWQRTGMNILYMPNMNEGYHIRVVAGKYLSGLTEA